VCRFGTETIRSAVFFDHRQINASISGSSRRSNRSSCQAGGLSFHFLFFSAHGERETRQDFITDPLPERICQIEELFFAGILLKGI
jgi:hypothetical protein